MRNRTDLIPLDKFEQLCRLCLKENDSIALLDVLDTELSNIFCSLIGIKIITNSAFPKFICKSCQKQIEDINSFLKRCSNSNSVLNLSLKAVESSPENHSIAAKDSVNINSSKNTNVEEQVHFLDRDKSHISPLLAEECSQLLDDNNVFSDASSDIQKLEEADYCSNNVKSDIALPLDTISSRFTCSVCNRALATSWAVKMHMKKHTGEKPFSCTYCDQKFAYRNSLIVHTRIHTGEKPYVCAICNRGYYSSTNLRKHKKVKHLLFEHTTSDNKNHRKCKICDKSFHKNGFGHHLRMHESGKKEFTCSFCHKKFLKNSHLERHIRIHTGEKPFTCQVCLKSFNQDGDLKRHLSVHSDTRGFQCQHCGKQYVTKGGLDNHLSTHSDVNTDGKFKCEYCSRSFNQSSQYKMHINSHTGQKPFLCTTCGKSFTANGSLKVHIRTHTGELPHVCKHCQQGFTNSSSLKRHIMRKHTGEKNYKCVICYKQYFSSSSLKSHWLRVHSLADKINIEKNAKDNKHSTE